MPIFFFRNDDVNILDPELVEVTRRCTEQGVPISHAVEPANVTDEAVAWLRDQKVRDPRLIEITQHGYDHELRDRGEFGGDRSYEDALADLERGRDILLEKFDGDFLSALNFPFGIYNQNAMRAADATGFRIICSHFNARKSRRLMYAVGRTLGMGQFLGKHISHNLDYYPRTKMFSVDVSISFIDRYIGPHGSNTCTFHSLDEIKRRVEMWMPHTPVIGLLFHHRFHHQAENMELITQAIEWLKTIEGAEFLNIGEIYQRYCPDPGTGFRDA